MKFMHCLPALTYDELMKPPGPGFACYVTRILSEEGFLVIKLGPSGRDLITKLHATLSSFWANLPSKSVLESPDQYGEDTHRSYFHVSPGHQYYPWHKAGKEDTQVIRTYEEIAHQITTQIFGFVCQTYDLTLTCSAKESFLRLMQYPTLTSKMAPPDYHDDVGLLALAPCSNVGAGLQFRFLPWTRKIIELETVLEADEVVVFPGMSLEFASGGRIRAVKHNVRNQERPRLNAVYQLRPQGDCYILTKEGTLTAKQFMERIVRKEAQDRLREEEKWLEDHMSSFDEAVVNSRLARRVLPVFSDYYEKLVDVVPYREPMENVMTEPLYSGANVTNPLWA